MYGIASIQTNCFYVVENTWEVRQALIPEFEITKTGGYLYIAFNKEGSEELIQKCVWGGLSYLYKATHVYTTTLVNYIHHRRHQLQETKEMADGKGALGNQVDGDHYKKMKIQPVEYSEANGLSLMEGNVVKYITRHRHKNGIKDLRKAIHCIELLIELINNGTIDYPEELKNA